MTDLPANPFAEEIKCEVDYFNMLKPVLDDVLNIESSGLSKIILDYVNFSIEDIKHIVLDEHTINRDFMCVSLNNIPHVLCWDGYHEKLTLYDLGDGMEVELDYPNLNAFNELVSFNYENEQYLVTFYWNNKNKCINVKLYKFYVARHRFILKRVNSHYQFKSTPILFPKTFTHNKKLYDLLDFSWRKHPTFRAVDGYIYFEETSNLDSMSAQPPDYNIYAICIRDLVKGKMTLEKHLTIKRNNKNKQYAFLQLHNIEKRNDKITYYISTHKLNQFPEYVAYPDAREPDTWKYYDQICKYYHPDDCDFMCKMKVFKIVVDDPYDLAVISDLKKYLTDINFELHHRCNFDSNICNGINQFAIFEDRMYLGEGFHFNKNICLQITKKDINYTFAARIFQYMFHFQYITTIGDVDYFYIGGESAKYICKV